MCSDEVARKVILSEQSKGSDGVPWDNVSRFSKLVFIKTKKEFELNTESVFCDRSLLDNIAYLKAYHQQVPQELFFFPFHESYQKIVFYAPSWPEIYKKDEQRLQDLEEHDLLSKNIKDTYLAAGFKLVELPFSSVESRVDFVLERLANFL